MIKIKSYRVPRTGMATIFLPAVWMRDLDIQPGEYLDVYRDELDRLIIVPPTKKASV